TTLRSYILWRRAHVFLDQRPNFFIIFRNRKIGILAEAMQKNHGIQNVAAANATPSKETAISTIKFVKCHPSITPLTMHFIFLLIRFVSNRHYSLLLTKPP